jgi:hypothetical protein
LFEIQGAAMASNASLRAMKRAAPASATMASNARFSRDATSSRQLHGEELEPAHQVSRGLLVVELGEVRLAQVSIVGARRKHVVDGVQNLACE